MANTNHPGWAAARRSILLHCLAILLMAAPVATALGAPAKSADEVIQSVYGMAWEQIPSYPRPTKQVIPRYPSRTRNHFEQAVVKAVFRVDADGRVQDLRCLCDTNTEVASECHSALVRWRFPKKQGGPYRLMMTFSPGADLAHVNITVE